jgi:hypothetical protein
MRTGRRCKSKRRTLNTGESIKESQQLALERSRLKHQRFKNMYLNPKHIIWAFQKQNLTIFFEDNFWGFISKISSTRV